MKLRLDTHLLFWAAGAPDRLSRDFRSLIDDSERELLFSAASLWEVAIKRGLGRHDFRVDGRLLRGGLLDNRYSRLPIVSDLAVAIELADASVRSCVGGTGDRGGCHAAVVSRLQVSAVAPAT
ncbi:MAG TPA: type II toxin-antitoxin system VapC family toxin [Candidatus Sulfotelmatobacter sp.]|nr:type II toxin-antitoxin system VapC family toxin [Candidatus Sulfotelmatobacter sp.]